MSCRLQENATNLTISVYWLDKTETSREPCNSICLTNCITTMDDSKITKENCELIGKGFSVAFLGRNSVVRK